MYKSEVDPNHNLVVKEKEKEGRSSRTTATVGKVASDTKRFGTKLESLPYLCMNFEQFTDG